MHPSHIADGGIVTAIEFETDGYPFEVWDLEGLCEVAGCTCIEATLTCNNHEALFYNDEVAKAYAGPCLHTCRCIALIDKGPMGNDTSVTRVDSKAVLNLPQYHG